MKITLLFTLATLALIGTTEAADPAPASAKDTKAEPAKAEKAKEKLTKK